MQGKDKLRLIRRLLTLTVLAGCLGFLTSGRPAAAGPDCDPAYDACNAGCTLIFDFQEQLNCSGACFREYQWCVAHPDG
jgi:hypothetical protein